jgi:hypothetical protein
MGLLEIHNCFDGPAARLQAATAAGKIALEACRVGLETGSMRMLDIGTPSGSVTCDLIDSLCAEDLTVANLHRYASVLAAGGQHDAVLKLIESRYAALLMPRQTTEQEREAAKVLARLWMENIQEQILDRYRDGILYKPESVGRALLAVGRVEAAPQK